MTCVVHETSSDVDVAVSILVRGKVQVQVRVDIVPILRDESQLRRWVFLVCESI